MGLLLILWLIGGMREEGRGKRKKNVGIRDADFRRFVVRRTYMLKKKRDEKKRTLGVEYTGSGRRIFKLYEQRKEKEIYLESKIRILEDLLFNYIFL